MTHTLQAFYPASIFDLENLEMGLQLCSKTLNFNISESTPPNTHHFYAGTKNDRAHSFIEAIKNDNITIAWAARGGYGTIDWLDVLPTTTNSYQHKKIIGFSDLTALHAHLNNIGIITIHGPMLATKGFIEAIPSELQSLLMAIADRSQNFEIKQGIPKQGKLIGGNLSVLSHLMGTPWQLQLSPGDLLFLEDINEAPYALARSLRQLSYSPHFEDCHLIWGQLTNCGDLQELELLKVIMEPYKNSWSYGLNVGHDRPNFSIQLGKMTTMSENAISQ